ncbi:MAG: IS5 family transposase [Alphaproteobacteria bacterium]|nr:MAG: IS5 family transposase [Alphaproteobacteria bacterium]
MSQPGFFDLDDRLKKLNNKDPLVGLSQLIDWEGFRDTLSAVRTKERKSNAGRKPYDALLMFKVLVLQHLYNLSDEQTEYQVRDRYSFMRFLGLQPEDSVPDAKTLWCFREELVRLNLMKELFKDFDYQLDAQGYKAQKGQIVDASFVDVPRQRNTREENEQIKAGEIPQDFQEKPHVGRQKDTDARWAKKNKETHFGYKNHVAVDNQHKLIRNYEVTSAEVHDSNQFIEILAENTSKDVWADSAYYSQEVEMELAAMDYRSHVQRKGKRNCPLNERALEANHKKSKIRSRVEHVFGSITNEQGGLFSRVIGMARTALKVGMMNVVYNMRRFVSLHRMSAPQI